jgi:hypothetical protein
MTLLAPRLIAPDSSHWAKWLDAMRSPDPDRRSRAAGLHARLIEQGRIPLLSWHHLEELLGHEDPDRVRARVSALQRLPMIAWLRLPGEEAGLGSIVQILAAEAIAASEGHLGLIAIRDRARALLLRTGTGEQAIGEHGWVWDAVRPVLRARQDSSAMVAALGPLRTFDDSKTIGELAKGSIASPEQMRVQFSAIRAAVVEQALRGSDGDRAKAEAMADAFMQRVVGMMPPPGASVRDLLVARLTEQGLDEEEIGDECVLADLSKLGTFRSQLRVIASETGRSFEALKQIPLDRLPSRIIDEALRTYGQPREKLPASDVNDAHLAVLAAYCDVLYVDKRTAEDFRQARQKDKRLEGLIGDVAKGADFQVLLGAAG